MYVYCESFELNSCWSIRTFEMVSESWSTKNTLCVLIIIIIIKTSTFRRFTFSVSSVPYALAKSSRLSTQNVMWIWFLRYHHYHIFVAHGSIIYIYSFLKIHVRGLHSSTSRTFALCTMALPVTIYGMN